MIPEKPNLEIGPLKASDDIVNLAEAALLEMAPLEAGFFLRDLNMNLPVTMDAISRAKERMGILVRSFTNKATILEIGTKAGFTEEQITEAAKLEIIECKRNPTRYCLRGKFNKLLFETKVEIQT